MKLLTKREKKIIEYIRNYDTPTISNSLELLDPTLRSKGHTQKTMHCLNPSLKPIIGFAKTAIITSRKKKNTNIIKNRENTNNILEISKKKTHFTYTQHHTKCDVRNVIIIKLFNDLTQLTLGLDRDSELVQHLYEERNEAVKMMISQAIKTCKRNNVKIGICGQAPSDHTDFAQFLVKENIDSFSITPDSVVKTIKTVNKIENDGSQIIYIQ